MEYVLVLLMAGILLHIITYPCLAACSLPVEAPEGDVQKKPLQSVWSSAYSAIYSYQGLSIWIALPLAEETTE